MHHSCSEDYHHASYFPTEKEKEDFYINIKSAAESGWDFSSRWFIANGTNAGKIKVSITSISQTNKKIHSFQKQLFSALKINFSYCGSVYFKIFYAHSVMIYFLNLLINKAFGIEPI